MRRAPIWPPARPYVRVGSSWAYVCLPGDLANRQIAGHSVGVRHDADLVPAAFAAPHFPPDGHPGASHGPRRRVRRRKDGAHARRVRHHTFPFRTRQPIRQRGGRIHQPARQEGTHPQERLHERGATTLGRQPVRVVVQPPTAPLDPRVPEPRGVSHNKEKPSRNSPTHRCQSNLPKRTRIEPSMADEMQAIVDETDNRPMRVLGYRTPAEAFADELLELTEQTRALHF